MPEPQKGCTISRRGRVSLVFALVIGFSLSALPARTAPPAPDASAVLATVDDQTITVDDLRREIARRERTYPGRYGRPGESEALLNELVRLEILAARGRATGLDRDPEFQRTIRRAMARTYEEGVLEPKLRELAVTDQEVEAYYADHAAEFTLPRMVRAALIQIKTSPKDSADKLAEQRRRAESALQEAKILPPGTPTFGATAVKYSEDQASRYRGGETGWLTEGAKKPPWDQAVIEAVFSLPKPGDLSPVIATPGGFYLAKLIERRESGVRPLTEVRELIRRKLFAGKKDAITRDFYREEGGKVKVEVNRDLLKALVTEETAKERPTAASGDGPPPLPGK